MSRLVTLTGGSPWGFTLEGGKDFGTQIKITKVTSGGKAMRGGVQVGEYILEINNQDTLPLTHHAAQQVIRSTGQTLILKLSSQPARRVTIIEPSPSPSPVPGSQSPSQGRPRPPPPPTTTPTSTTPTSNKPGPPPVTPSPNKVPVHQRPVVVKSAVSPEPVASDSILVPESGLMTGSESTFQSPAFKKITVEQPSVLSPRSAKEQYTSPPVEAMKNVTIEDGNTYKSSTRPPPPSKAPTVFTPTTMKISSTTGPKSPATVTKPSPPSVKRPQPPPSPSTKISPTLPSTSTTPTSAAKVTNRQGVCEACGQPIRGAYASAMNKVWHPEHFTCFRCQKQLSNTSFVYEDDKIFCSNCYETKVAETCFSCKRPIVGGMVNAANRYYHSQCFRCSQCSVDLGTQEGFNMENSNLFCQDCYGDSYGAVCHGCKGKISANVLWVEALDHTWHPECFICGGCNRPLEGGRFFAKLGQPFCGNCC